MQSFEFYWTLILISAITECVFISASASLVSINIKIRSSAIGLKICAKTAEIKSINQLRKGKKHDEIVLLAKSKLNSIEVLIFKALVYSNISHDEFILMNGMLNELYHMKEEIKNSNDK